MHRARLLAIVLLLILPAGAGLSRAQATGYWRIQYDDSVAGGPRTMLDVPDSLEPLLGAFAVCADHAVFAATDSIACPSSGPGIYWACTPPGAGWCNATLTLWGTGDYKFDVAIAGVSSGSLAMG